jgi:hypothetical protein
VSIAKTASAPFGNDRFLAIMLEISKYLAFFIRDRRTDWYHHPQFSTAFAMLTALTAVTAVLSMDFFLETKVR